GGTSTGTSCASDSCPAPNGGVTINCEKRFMYGVNYAWSYFAGDFGGISAWSQEGVAGAKAARTADLTDMKNNGVDVVRWWMYPDLGGDGVKLDSTGTPTGLGATVADDIAAALAIAASLDIHIKLTLFSFDSFWNTYTNSGLTFPSLQPIATDSTKLAALITTVVTPIAQAVQASPNKDRMIAWDVINEPEWSIAAGQDPYGDQAFDPTTAGSNGQTMATVSFAQMETFIKTVVTALHANSSAPVTVGSAAVKWAQAWSQVGLDFHDFHWYGWVDQYFPHTQPPSYYKVSDKPVVVGEFPLAPASDTTGESFGGISYGQLLDDLFSEGYAGAQGWAFSDTSSPAFSWASAKTNVAAWASAHPCYTQY
ncbi:MAG: endo-1,4-beta-glucanase, partial [Polyangia bacterium]